MQAGSGKRSKNEVTGIRKAMWKKITINSLSDLLHISPPTLYTYIKKYDKGETEDIDKDLLSFFEAIEDGTKSADEVKALAYKMFVIDKTVVDECGIADAVSSDPQLVKVHQPDTSIKQEKTIGRKTGNTLIKYSPVPTLFRYELDDFMIESLMDRLTVSEDAYQTLLEFVKESLGDRYGVARRTPPVFDVSLTKTPSKDTMTREFDLAGVWLELFSKILNDKMFAASPLDYLSTLKTQVDEARDAIRRIKEVNPNDSNQVLSKVMELNSERKVKIQSELNQWFALFAIRLNDPSGMYHTAVFKDESREQVENRMTQAPANVNGPFILLTFKFGPFFNDKDARDVISYVELELKSSGFLIGKSEARVKAWFDSIGDKQFLKYDRGSPRAIECPSAGGVPN